MPALAQTGDQLAAARLLGERGLSSGQDGEGGAAHTTACLAGSHIGRIDHRRGAAEVLEPPTADQGARRVWSDWRGRVWLSEWTAGQLAATTGRRRLAGVEAAGANPMASAV